jgi:hypothetical protein
MADNPCNLTLHRPCPSTPSNIVVGNGVLLLVILLIHILSRSPLFLNNVLVTLNLLTNLLSVCRFTIDNNCSIEFDDWVIWRPQESVWMVDEKPMTAFSIGLGYGISQGICL